MNMIYRSDGPAWTVWTPNRRLIAWHLREARLARIAAKLCITSYASRLYKEAAWYQLELARRERVGLGGVYGIHQGN